MELLRQLIDFVLHIDTHLNDMIVTYGGWTYAILFAIIFSETGLVVAPFLPGDSLLFAAGAFAAAGSLDPAYLFLLLSAAAIAGNIVNYSIGSALGPKLTAGGKVRLINEAYLARAHAFYEKNGGLTIVIARFLPILRTFAPFVAGIGLMSYPKFMIYNVAAGLLWVGCFVFGGYYFGNIPAVKSNFTLVIAAIIVISTIPALVEGYRHWSKRNRSAGTDSN